MSVVMRTQSINFPTWDDSQDRLAILGMNSAPRGGEASNLHHMAFTYDKLAETASVYKTLKVEGISPHWCVNHGPTTSFYYHDPDGNSVELSVDHFQDVRDLNAWLATGAFNSNPIGVTLDPEELISRLEKEPEEAILKPHPDHPTGLQREIERRSKAK